MPTRFFLAGGCVVICFVVGFAFEPVFIAARIVFLVFIAAAITDALLLFRSIMNVRCVRLLPRTFSLSDENGVTLSLRNVSTLPINVTVIEELPEQFQERNFKMRLKLDADVGTKLRYTLRPLTRGEYKFGNTLLYISSLLGLVERRITVIHPSIIPVYPSVLQMKNMEMRAFSKVSRFQGIRKLRRIGHTYEFDQIKNYVSGDDYRSINWKATGKKGSLMVNQYEDERAQQIYFVIDKSRSMRMPFNGLSLLDYAINTTLVMSNIAMRKQDRAGLISFSTKVDGLIKADRSFSHMRRILGQLYREKENRRESNYELLYSAVRNSITARSLLMLFTNFESIYAMERVLPVLRKLSRQHLLVVVFFKNTELEDYAQEDSTSVRDIYLRTVASKLIDEKEQIVSQLRLYGIQALYTAPESLTVDVLNKYLELKSRGMI